MEGVRDVFVETLPAHNMQWKSKKSALAHAWLVCIGCFRREVHRADKLQGVVSLRSTEIQSNVSPVVASSCLSYEVSLVFRWGLAVL